MSNNNQAKDEVQAAVLVFALIGAVIYAAMLFIFAVAAFLTLLLTILCLFAWNEPITLGKYGLAPQEARAFVWRGLIGAALAPAFALFCAVIFQFPLPPEVWPYILGVGYVFGSLGVLVFQEQNNGDDAGVEDTATPMLPPPSTPASEIVPPKRLPAPPAASAAPAESFRFATWDDEEQGR